MASLKTLVIVPALFFALFACGGEVAPDAGALYVDPAAGSFDESLGELLVVPDGEARMGGWYVENSHYYPLTSVVPTFRVAVRAYKLMKFEVTQRSYGHCVTDGACSPNASTGDSDLPARVDYFQARAFCRHNGGDLPTPGQWMHAAQGPTPGFGIPSLTSAYVSCLGPKNDEPICSDFRSMSQRGTPSGAPWELLHPGGRPWDVGPFGHYDLFANALEWLRSWGDRASIPVDALVSDTSMIAPNATSENVLSAQLFVITARLSNPQDTFTWEAESVRPPSDTQSYRGVRCAFR